MCYCSVKRLLGKSTTTTTRRTTAEAVAEKSNTKKILPMESFKSSIARYYGTVCRSYPPSNIMLDFLSSNQPIERSFMRIPRFSATAAGFWPQEHQSVFTVLRFLINSFAVAVGAVGELSYGIVYLSNLVAALEAFCPGSTKLISVLKMWTFFVFNKDWHLIISQLHEMIMQDAANPAKRRIIERLAAASAVLSFILLASGSVTNAFFNLHPIITMIVRKLQGLEIGHDLPFNTVTTEVLVNYPWYPLTYGILTLSGAMTVFTFSAVDGLFVCICFYASGLFRMLQLDIRQVFAELELSDKKPTSEQNFRIRRNLAKIVRRHNKILDLCTKFTTKFSFIILWHFLSAAFVLCLSLLDLMLNYTSIAVLIYIFYSIAASTQLFLYCIGGNYVSESSVEIADTLYDVPWYKCDTETRRMILMMMRRSQKPKRIAVPFFTASLPAFSSIISTAGSYIALLKTFL